MALPTSTNDISVAARESGLPGSAEGPQDAYRHILGGVIVGHYFGVGGRAIVGLVNLLERHQPNRTLDSRLNDIHNNNVGFEIGLQDGTLDEKLGLVADMFRKPGGNDRQPGRPAYTNTEYGTAFDIRTHAVIDSLQGRMDGTARSKPTQTPAPASGDMHGPPPPPVERGEKPEKPPVITRPLGKVVDENIALIDLSEKELLFLLRLLITEINPPSIDDDGVPEKPIDPPTLKQTLQKLRTEASGVSLRDFMNAIITLNAGNPKLLEKSLLEFMRRLRTPNPQGTLLDAITDWTVTDPPKERFSRKPGGRL